MGFFLLNGKGAHGIVGREDKGLLVKHVQELLRHDRLLKDHLVNKLGEPLVAHDQVTLVASLLAPRVLDTPANRVAVAVEVHAGELHGVGHQTLAVEQALSLGHVEGDIEGQVVLEHLGVQSTGVPLQVLADICTKPHLCMKIKK